MENNIGKFQGKRIMVLGSNVGSKDIVLYAMQNGAHTIVADYYPIEKSEAKQVATEHLLISTADTDELANYIKRHPVDAIIAGVHEFNLLQAMKLSEIFHLKFYCTREQWDMIENKALFRRLCYDYRVPCPKTYFIGKEISDDELYKISGPSVIKPVDNGASQGVHFCFSPNDLIKHREDALNSSDSNTIIIEELVQGEEFTAHYTIYDGTITLSSIDNRYPVKVHEGHVTTIPIARMYPCYFIDEYINQVDANIRKLIASLNLKNAVVFFQGLYDPISNRFSIFEGGLRCAGEASYRILEKVNGINYLHMIIDYLLSTDSSFKSEKEDPYLNGHYAGVVSFVSKGGKVGKITGVEETIARINHVIHYENRYPVGYETPKGDTLRQLMLRFVLVCNSKQEMIADIENLNENIDVEDVNGNEMVIKMNPNIIIFPGDNRE